MLVPMVYVINNAFKPLEELFRYPPTLFVQNPTLKNFTDMFNLLNETSMPFLRYLFNTVFLTVVAAAGQIIFASLCAYSLAKIPYPGSRFIFKLIIFSLMFSGTVTQVPSFIIFAKLGLIDTYWGMIIPSLVSTMGLYLMKQFMDTNVPNELLEAARIDGASEIRIFFKIVMLKACLVHPDYSVNSEPLGRFEQQHLPRGFQNNAAGSFSDSRGRNRTDGRKRCGVAHYACCSDNLFPVYAVKNC